MNEEMYDSDGQHNSDCIYKGEAGHDGDCVYDTSNQN
jgi:hypothetical protein